MAFPLPQAPQSHIKFPLGLQFLQWGVESKVNNKFSWHCGMLLKRPTPIFLLETTGDERDREKEAGLTAANTQVWVDYILPCSMPEWRCQLVALQM